MKLKDKVLDWPDLPTECESQHMSERRRRIELIVAVIAALMLILLSRVETKVYSLSAVISEKQQFLTTLAYFALININVILILVLSFLIFRNLTRLVMARRKGVIGSRLRTKLVVALMFFALAPTSLLIYVSHGFIARSFDHWFSGRVASSIRQTKEAWSLAYERDQARLQSLSLLAVNRVQWIHRSPYRVGENRDWNFIWDVSALSGFTAEYGIDEVRVFDRYGMSVDSLAQASSWYLKPNEFVLEAVQKMNSFPYPLSVGGVVAGDQKDIVLGATALVERKSGLVIGLVVTELGFQTQMVRSLERIIDDFATLRTSAQFVRFSYMILMAVITLLIIFSATWLGLHVARTITRPLLRLTGGIRQLAEGNYDVRLEDQSDDETGQLAQAFNHMVVDLRTHEQRTKQARQRLQQSNEELRQRRQYMEFVLKHISAGILSLDSKNRITSLNAAAEKLLRVHGSQLMGESIEKVLPVQIHQQFWKPIARGLLGKSSVRLQLDLHPTGLDAAMIVQATRIYTDLNKELGVVVVFHDAEEQVQAQRVAAWREVARRIAHEIKNPITPIKLNAQRLARKFTHRFEGEDKEVFVSCIESIIHQVNGLRDLVNQFSNSSTMPRLQLKT
ncbi:MAG: HAMP domain-containing protein, partial [Zetaproteobacteria bacterium]|nr:HAMP domain-containing protein [Zetaproteobacteria bacterium]